MTPTRGRLSVSYTEVALPLSLSMIRKDIQIGSRPRIEEIVMWQHQLDWLVKAYRRDRFLKAPVAAHQYWVQQFSTPYDLPEPEPAVVVEGPARVFGIPVRVANP